MELLTPPYDLAAAFAEVYKQVLPDMPMYHAILSDAEGYEPLIAKADKAIRQSGDFEIPERTRFDSSRVYTREEWLDYVPTMGGHSRFAPEQLSALLAGIGEAIDTSGSEFTVSMVTVGVSARRTDG